MGIFTVSWGLNGKVPFITVSCAGYLLIAHTLTRFVFLLSAQGGVPDAVWRKAEQQPHRPFECLQGVQEV